MYCWRLRRTDVLITANGVHLLSMVIWADLLLMINQNWGIVDGKPKTDVLMYLLKVGGDEVLLIVNKNWGIDDGERIWCILDGKQDFRYWWRLTEVSYWWRLTEMLHCWWLTRNEVLLMVIGDDALLMVYKNWSIDDS